MGKTRMWGKLVLFIVSVAGFGICGIAGAAEMNDYCVVPSFIQESAKPNLLMIIDNSASMYDLAYVDKGKKVCSGSGADCTNTGICPSGQTCSFTSGRRPYYCFDQTYRSDNTYVGYFTADTFYKYNIGTDDFSVGAFPGDCGTHANTTTKKDNAANTVCVEYKADASRALVSFVAKGNYLNWLTASKFDVEKQVLTGGKFVSKVCSGDTNRACTENSDCLSGQTCNAVSSFLQPESRGCVGQGFIKQALTADFANYKTADVRCTNNPGTPCTSDANCPSGDTCNLPPSNTLLPLTFSIHGPTNPHNSTSPSIGGQTYIDLFASNRKYDYGSCQAAVDVLASTTASNATVKQTVAACLTGSTSGYCSENIGIECFSTFPDCYVPGKCTVTNTACTKNSDCTSPNTCVLGFFCEAADGSPTAQSCPTPGVSASCPKNLYFCDEGNPSPYTLPKALTESCSAANVNTVTGCLTPATYWCDWSTSWRNKSCSGVMTNDPVCASGNTEQGKCSLKPQRSCSTDLDCSSRGDGVCQGFISQGGHDCIVKTPVINHGTCREIQGGGNGICGGQKDFGLCTFGNTEILTKTKVNFQQTMQACWQYNRFVSGVGGADIGIDDIKTLDKQCADIYNGSGNTPAHMTCSNDRSKTCTAATAAAVCGVGNSCTGGPNAIGPGYPAFICGSNYAGQLYYKKNGVWIKMGSFNDATNTLADLRITGTLIDEITTVTNASVSTPAACSSTDFYKDCVKKIYLGFCNANAAPPVTDPSDSPSDTATAENLPAILSGIGVEAQLGSPIKTMRARIAKDSPPPPGLVQDYGSKIRIGLMAFNSFGSAAEVTGGLLAGTKICSNDPDKTCMQNLDCGAGNTCGSAANKDGASVLSLIGKGRCLTSAGTGSGTTCTKKAHCPTIGETCVPDGIGDYTTGLVKSINTLRAATWTPFAESFYNAIGYFAVDPADATGKSSRTGLRINSTGTEFLGGVKDPAVSYKDFPDAMNPSEYICQSNNILLITDGASTADQNSTKSALVDTYKAVSGNVTGTCPKYAGSKDLDDLAWLAKKRNINTFDKSTASTDVPTKKSQYITSYIVFNGADNGEAGECNNTTLLTKAAESGGTELLKTDIPEQYQETLRKAFESVAGGTASGTAASILSNSEGSGANILQAVFFPRRDFADSTSVSWIGEMQNLWYFVDPFVGNSSVREDTGYVSGDHVMNLTSDYVAEFYFDPVTNDTRARLLKDTNGDGSGDVLVTSVDDPRVTASVPGVIQADSVASIWRAGRLLWDRNLATNPRVLYTYLNGATAAGCSGSFSKTSMFNLLTFTWGADNDSCILQKYLDAATQDEAKSIIRYIHGYDTKADNTPLVINEKNARKRAVKLVKDGPAKVWKLGDIVSSTPRVQSSGKVNNYHLPPAAGYGDTTYADDAARTGFANTSDYKSRGMVYAGANDGMLHAFKLGTLTVTTQGATKAKLTGNNLGEEQWAFIPKNVLPYLKYLADPGYSHLYLVDGNTKIVDASIGYDGSSVAAFAGASCTADTYWDCKRVPTTTSWRTILIGSMGVGGASRPKIDNTCTDKVAAGSCVKAPTDEAGASSYYALDITNPTAPQFLWEFSDPSMGFSTTGAGVARITYTNGTGKPYKESNGRWYAVIGNGPTGPIDTITHQFKGKSDKPLKIFVLDLKNGAKNSTYYKTLEAASLTNTFAGSLGDATIDTDRWNKTSDGFYSDDALYFGYTQCTANCDADVPTWDGGVARLLTHEKPDPADWELTQLITGTGPVTTSIGRLQDRRYHNLWLYFGSGRYFFKEDDQATARTLIGVKDPCYKGNDDLSAPSGDTCKAAINFSSGTGFVDQSGTIDTTSTIAKGWFITLDGENVPTVNYSAERSITDPVAMPNGAVFFTTFKPSVDICSFGGNSYLWGVRYDTGGVAPGSALKAKALVQVSTGSFEEVDLATALTDKDGRKMGTPMVGKPPNDPPPIVSPAANKPLKRVIHIREK